MICPFCGVETHLPSGHDSQQACIAALRSEISSLRNVLKHTQRPDEPLIPLRRPDEDDPYRAGSHSRRE
jgi:hypothetical protein